jgi:N,N-dimethylformamidase
MLCGVGFVAQGFDRSSHYRRTEESRNPRVAFMFDGVEDDVLGDFGLLRGGAAGIEIDRVEDRYGTPSHALVVAHSENHTNIYEPFEDVVAMGQPLPGDRPPIRADMVFFECPGGGAVFSVGSIAYAGSLSHNGYRNNINRLTTNVLGRFLATAPFPMPSHASDI